MGGHGTRIMAHVMNDLGSRAIQGGPLVSTLPSADFKRAFDKSLRGLTS